jgi:hypothetical protein
MPLALVNIELGGGSFGMRPAYEAQRDIESRLGLTVAELLECAKDERLGIEEAAVIVWYGAKAAGDQFDELEAVGKRIFEKRMSDHGLRCSICQYLMELLYAPKVALKKFEAEVLPLLQEQSETI